MKDTFMEYDTFGLKKYAHDNFDKKVVCKKIINTCKKVIQENE